jgi:hypothetical protein
MAAKRSLAQKCRPLTEGSHGVVLTVGDVEIALHLLAFR